jgi:hypothetical protein
MEHMIEVNENQIIILVTSSNKIYPTTPHIVIIHHLMHQLEVLSPKSS